MKGIVLFCMMSMLGMALASCSSDSSENYIENDRVVIVPDRSLGNDVAEFFNAELPKSGMVSEGFFVGKSKQSLCHVINSTDELKALYTGNNPLPAIDFSNQTLIVGQHYVPESFYQVERMELRRKGGGYVLDLYVPEPEIMGFAFGYMYYWCLTTKLESSKMSVNVIVYSE